MAYIQAAQRGLHLIPMWGIRRVYEVYKRWRRDYDSQQQSQRGTDLWEELSKKKHWLHWEEVIETVKKQKEAYELAPPSIRQARENIQYMILLLLPPTWTGTGVSYTALSAMPPSEVKIFSSWATMVDRQRYTQGVTRLQNRKKIRSTSLTILYTTSTDTWQTPPHATSSIKVQWAQLHETHTHIHNASSNTPRRRDQGKILCLNHTKKEVLITHMELISNILPSRYMDWVICHFGTPNWYSLQQTK